MAELLRVEQKPNRNGKGTHVENIYRCNRCAKEIVLYRKISETKNTYCGACRKIVEKEKADNKRQMILDEAFAAGKAKTIEDLREAFVKALDPKALMIFDEAVESL